MIFKRLECQVCKHRERAEKEQKHVLSCPKCGGPRRYSAKWFVRVPQTAPDGKTVYREKAVHSNRKIAEAEETKLKNSRIIGEIFEGRKAIMLFETAVSAFLAECENRVLRGTMDPKTVTSYACRFNSIIPFFEGQDVHHITRKMIEAYRDDRMKNGHRRIMKRVDDELQFKESTHLTNAGVNREISAIRAMFSHLVREEIIKINPASRIEKLKESKRRDRCLTENEIDKLLENCHSRHLRLAVLIALNTGLRHHGCLTLKWEEIDLKRNEIRKVVKRGKEVRIPITKRLRKALLEKPGISGYVIPSTKRPGEPFRVDANIGFETACRKAEIEDFRFHDLRHTFCTWFITMTKDIHTCAQVVGHSTTYMTEHYSHLIDDHLRSQMKAFEEAWR